jgi:hypothetical protein
MESYINVSCCVEHSLTRETVRHGRTLLLAVTLLTGGLAGSPPAQPGSITSINESVYGPGIFDAAGNMYTFQSGPVTAGAAQTQNGGGTCVLPGNGFFGVFGPCSDAYVNKIDASGNLVWGAYLGGPTADQSTAVAADNAGNVYVTGSTSVWGTGFGLIDPPCATGVRRHQRRYVPQLIAWIACRVRSSAIRRQRTRNAMRRGAD